MTACASHRKTFCVCLAVALGLFVLYHLWKLSSRNGTDVAGSSVLGALKLLNARESNSSWIVTFSHQSFLTNSSSLHDNVKKYGVTLGRQRHHTKSVHSGLVNAFPQKNYIPDILPSQSTNFKLTTNKTWTDLSTKSVDSMKANVPDKRIDRFRSNQVSDVQQALKRMSSNSTAAGLVNVVAMSLYGAQPRYTAGAIHNAHLVRQNFPGWQLWIFIESPSSSKYPAVPEEIITRLIRLGAQVHYISPEDDFVPPMMWRFLVADDPAIDWFIVRDVDSRLTERDAAAVLAWMQSGDVFHCVRDHPSHAAYALSGGLWGAHAPRLRFILRKSWATMMRGVAAGYLDDMNFLNSVIWPRVERHTYCVDSVSCDRWSRSFPFPVARHNYEHVGQVYDEHDRARADDIRILKHSLDNRNCIPL